MTVAILSTLFFSFSALSQTVISVDPMGTYLRTSANDIANAPTTIDLNLLGAVEGDTILISGSGAYSPVNGANDVVFSLLGVLSDGTNFIAPDQNSTVPFPVPTFPSAEDGVPTDIAEDFRILEDEVSELVIPAGATQIRLSPNDNFFSDNTDANGDFELTLEIVVINNNNAPLLTDISTLAGAKKNRVFTIDYQTLRDASDASDADGDEISFRIETILPSTNELLKDGQPVVIGQTTVAAGESLTLKTSAVGDVDAFTVVAFDGQDVSATEVTVTVNVKKINKRLVRILKKRIKNIKRTIRVIERIKKIRTHQLKRILKRCKSPWKRTFIARFIKRIERFFDKRIESLEKTQERLQDRLDQELGR